MTTSSRHLLPIVTIQPTFHTVISEVDSGIIPFDNFWVSCYKESLPSVHTKINVKVNEIRRDVVDLEVDDPRVQIQAQTNTVSLYPLDPIGFVLTRLDTELVFYRLSGTGHSTYENSPPRSGICRPGTSRSTTRMSRSAMLM